MKSRSRLPVDHVSNPIKPLFLTNWQLTWKSSTWSWSARSASSTEIRRGVFSVSGRGVPYGNIAAETITNTIGGAFLTIVIVEYTPPSPRPKKEPILMIKAPILNQDCLWFRVLVTSYVLLILYKGKLRGCVFLLHGLLPLYWVC